MHHGSRHTVANGITPFPLRQIFSFDNNVTQNVTDPCYTRHVTQPNVTQEMLHMNLVLSDELRVRGLTKTALADLMNVSRQTIHRMGDEVSDEVLAILSDIPLVSVSVHPKDLPDDEMEKIIRNRAAVSDWDICQERGWRIWELNAAIAGWVKRNPYTKPENGYDLSRYVKGDVS